MEKSDAIKVTCRDPAALRVIFWDFHQVLDRSREGSSEAIGAIPNSNIDLVERILQFSEMDTVNKSTRKCCNLRVELRPVGLEA